jgi:uncharacterized protein YtpQ (UPF0354 family)
MSPKRGLSPDEFCKRAVAYVKGLLDEPEKPVDQPAVQLSLEDSPAFRPLCEGLGVMYLVDAGDRFEYVQYRDLRAFGLTIEQLHDTAVRNLAEIVQKRLEIRKHSNIFAFLMGGNFESSCMLVGDLFDRVLAPHVPNGYAAAVPARDLFAVCSRDSVAGIRELRELVNRAWPGGDHLVSKELFVREGGKWRPMK